MLEDMVLLKYLLLKMMKKLNLCLFQKLLVFELLMEKVVFLRKNLLLVVRLVKVKKIFLFSFFLPRFYIFFYFIFYFVSKGYILLFYFIRKFSLIFYFISFFIFYYKNFISNFKI